MESAVRTYCAFISYNHADEAVARWLQRSLESYRIPRHLLDKLQRASNRLGKVCRDREDLASSGDLTATIQAALDQSEFLLVLCSPAASQSAYVKQEIDYFLTHRSRSQVLCLVVGGEPDEVIPARLLEDRHEPLAADLRPAGDGRTNARLKLIAGLLDVGFDDLKMREALRQRRRWIIAGCSSFALTLAMGVLTVTAIVARQETERSRNQAEDLIGFMLTDLRSQLEPIGRLDVLDAVGNKAMSYFAEVEDGRDSASVLAKRSLALRQIGEIRIDQGRLDGAYAALVEAQRIARSRAKQFPEEFSAHYDLGQTEFWLGLTQSLRGDEEGAEAGYQAYLLAARQMVRVRPDSDIAQLELAMATINLGVLNAEAMQTDLALTYFLEGHRVLEGLRAGTENQDVLEELANLDSWIGDTYIHLGELDEARRYHEAHLRILRELGAGAGTDRIIDARLGDGLLVFVELLLRQNELTSAMAVNAEAKSIFEELVEHDPTNAYWLRGQLVAQLLAADICVRQEIAACAEGALTSARVLLANPTLAPLLQVEPAYLAVLETELLLSRQDGALSASQSVLTEALVHLGETNIENDSTRARQIAIRNRLLRARIRTMAADTAAAELELAEAQRRINEAKSTTSDPVFSALQDEAAQLTAALTE